jgi:hypothetical protein
VYGVTVGDFRICSKKNKKNEFQTKMSTCSIFELETSPWRQKLCLDLLVSDLSSEKISEVGNVLRIDRRGLLLLTMAAGP